MAAVPACSFYNGYMAHKHMRLAKEEEMKGGQSGPVVHPNTEQPRNMSAWFTISSIFGRDPKNTPALGSGILRNLTNASCESDNESSLGSC